MKTAPFVFLAFALFVAIPSEAADTTWPAEYEHFPMALHVPVNRPMTDLSQRLLSPAARSLAVYTDEKLFAKIGLTTANPACHPDADGVTCNVTLPVFTGHHTIALQVFDAPGGTGKLLARSRTAYFGNGVPANVIRVALWGVPASVSIGSAATGLVAGKPIDVPFEVIAKDADGYPILNTADYYAPIVLTMSPAGSSKLSNALVTAARQTLTLRYDGTTVKEIVIIASIPGLASSKLVLPVR